MLAYPSLLDTEKLVSDIIPDACLTIAMTSSKVKFSFMCK